MKKWQLLTVSILGLGLLGGCGSQKTRGNQESQGLEQKIAVSVPTELVTLDTTQTTDKNTFTIAQHLFEGLYRLDENSVPIPGLAKEAAEISQDGLTYTFKLRADAKWSNGDKITAGDFVYAWQKLVDPKTAAPNAYLLDSVKNSQEIRVGDKPVTDLGVTAIGEEEFQVQLIYPKQSFLTLISIAWLAPQNQAFVEAQGENYASDSDHLLFSGPFVINDWEQGSDTWTLKPNDAYYDRQEVKLTEISGTTIKEENTGIDLFNTGELDLTKLSGTFVAEYADDPSFVSHADIANTFLDFNKKPGTPLANENLRRAIALSIDKESLTKHALNDGAKPLNGLIPEKLFINPTNQEDFRAYSGDYLVYNKEAGKAAWALAQKDLGEEIELPLLVSDDDSGKKISEYIQNQLQENLPGLKITITPQPRTNVNQSRRDKDYQLSISSWMAGDNDLGMYFILYETDSAYNYGSFSNSSYDKLAVSAKTTNANDVTKQFTDYQAAEKILLEEGVAQVPLFQSASNYLINPKITGIEYPSYGNYFYLRNAQLTD